MNGFYKEVMCLLMASLTNCYTDNFDNDIRKLRLSRKFVILFEAVVCTLARQLGQHTSLLILRNSNYFIKNISLFAATYDLLSDEQSRRKYVELIAYKILRSTKVKLSLNTAEFWASRTAVGKYKKATRIPVSNFRSRHLDLFDLTEIGSDVKLYFVENGIFLDFVLQQYNYNDIVSVRPDDVVIDAGACWGDTALYFASRGASQIFAYEFIPSNIDIFKKNMSLNPKWREAIHLIDKAVWNVSEIELSYHDKGPASRVGGPGVYGSSTKTLSIDSLAEKHALDRIDFIKMDIEGAELSALEGAQKTIRMHKPKLAISVYHKPDDLIAIPAYIRSLHENYALYLDYYTIIGDEIVLYAIDQH